jgi:hypothetical protein
VRKPEERLKGHLGGAQTVNGNLHVNRWLRKLGVLPQLIIIEEVPEEELNDAERHWIFVMKMIGAPLTNLTGGGDGGARREESLAAETREKMSTAHRKRFASPEERAKQSERMSTPQARARMSAAQRGRKHSPETRAKISEGNRGRKHSIETRAKMSISGKLAAKKRPPKPARVKIPKIKIKQAVSLETRAKMSKSRLGKKHSPEAKAKISAAHRVRHERLRHKRNTIILRIIADVEHTLTVIAYSDGKRVT